MSAYRRLPEEFVDWQFVELYEGPLDGRRIYVPLDEQKRVPELLGQEELEEISVRGWHPGLNATGYIWSEARGAYYFDEQPTGEGPWVGV
jgi:hypothetical protein